MKGANLLIGVSGAKGFIGRAFSRNLSDRGHQVIKFSRYAMPGFSSFEDNKVMASCDTFVHLGEPANIQQFNLAESVGQESLSELLQSLVDRFESRLVYASSGAVYGKSSLEPHTVLDDTYGYDSYTAMKLRNEDIVMANGGRVLRLANIFGPGMSAETAIPRLTKQIRGNRIINLRQNAIRDYLYVDEAVRAISLATERTTTPILNIGSGVGRDIAGLVGVLARVLGIEDLIIEEGDSVPVINCSILSVDETVRWLDWHPNLEFADQIERTLVAEGEAV